MDNNKHSAGMLNDLIRVNNDRMEVYQRVIKEAGDGDVDLKAIFSRMVDESRQYISQLSHEVNKLGEEPVAMGTTVSGKINRIWMDVKSAVTGSDRLSLLESAEVGEDAAQKAYKEALVSDQTLNNDIRQLIAAQEQALKLSHDTIRKFRDMHRKADSDDIVNSNSLRSSDNDLRSEKSLSGGIN